MKILKIRVDEMIEHGFIDEVKNLIDSGYS